MIVPPDNYCHRPITWLEAIVGLIFFLALVLFMPVLYHRPDIMDIIPEVTMPVGRVFNLVLLLSAVFLSSYFLTRIVYGV